ncbi:MAG: hypothetical protein ABL860_08885 [Candidatus Nitrotoga sp.]
MASPQIIARTESEEPPMRQAVLTGADHALAVAGKNLLVSLALLREAALARIHGNFTSSTREAVHCHA